MKTSTSQNPFFSAPHALFAAPSPFASQAADDSVPADAPEGSYTYALVAQEPALTADAVETSELALAVTIRWGSNVLHVAHLSPMRSFSVGESDDCDYFVPAEKLGAERVEVAKVERGQVMLSTGQALAAGEKAKVACGDLVIECSVERAGKKVAGKVKLEGRSFAATALSLAVQGGLLAAAAFLVPPLTDGSSEGVSEDKQYYMAQMLQASATPEAKELETNEQGSSAPGSANGSPAAGESGKLGSQVSAHKSGRYAVEGKASETKLSRSDTLRLAADFGMVGMLNTMGGDAKALAAPWGSVAQGTDPLSANGNMWANTIHDASGSGGLGLTGIGDGGGCQSGDCTGVGIGNVATIGHGGGLLPGAFPGPGGQGFSNGLPPSGHRPNGVSMRPNGDTKVSGRIPPEVIQRVVRQNFGRMRACYESGLRGNPSLAGRVSVRFVIGSSGAVMSAANGGSDLPDPGVVSCVVRQFSGMSFPQPEGGVVTVSYPITFSPAQ